MRWLTNIIVIFVFFYFVSIANAQSGCCSHHGGVSGCDSSVGRQVCNDGTYSPSCTCYVAPRVTNPTLAPISAPKLDVKATTNYDYSSKLNKFSIKFDWTDVQNSQGYSVSISKIPGSDPGPLIDTKKSVWRFNLLSSGVWYANLKSFNGNSWSPVTYWTVNLPNKQTTITKSIATPTQKPTTQSFSCNCSKTCTQISSCAEAYYQLNNCGCSVRDGDNDGVPCENLCR